MIDLRSARLLDFVPESIAEDPEIVAMSLAIDPEVQEVAAAIVEAVVLARIDELSEAVCDEVAWDHRLNELQLWDDATLAGKRALLRNVFAIRKKSGTRFAVRRIFDLLNLVGTVIEWWEEAAPPNTYRLRVAVVGDPGISLRTILQIPELLHRFARASQQLTELGVEADQRGPLNPYPALTVGHHTTIGFGAP